MGAKPMNHARILLSLVGALVTIWWSHPCLGLDKQGSAHGGQVSGDEAAFNVSGTLFLGVAPYNPSYAARPDNSGLTLMRYGAHVDLDLWGPRLSVPLDVNLFSDRLRPGMDAMAPSEFDLIGGLSSTIDAGPGSLEVGTRIEHDRPVGTGTFTQTYADARARYLYSLAAAVPAFARAWPHTDLTGWVTLGWFVFNPSYAARPDNSGLAALRYALHTELSVLDDRVSVGLDATCFTDRHSNAWRPSELDWTTELIVHWAPVEVHLAWERDMPLDRNGLVQQFVYLLVATNFDLRTALPRAFSHKNIVPSP